MIGQDDAVLVGNFDWLEETPKGLHILDFKTGKEEDENSQQLPLYALLAEHNLKKPVTRVSYWYLDRDDDPIEVKIPNLSQTHSAVKTKTLEVQKAVLEKNFTCQEELGYCRSCHEYHKAVNEQAEHVQTDFKRKREVFFVDS